MGRVPVVACSVRDWHPPYGRHLSRQLGLQALVFGDANHRDHQVVLLSGGQVVRDVIADHIHKVETEFVTNAISWKNGLWNSVDLLAGRCHVLARNPAAFRDTVRAQVACGVVVAPPSITPIRLPSVESVRA